MSNKLIADLMSFRSRMVTDLRTQVMFEGDFDTIDQAIAELKRQQLASQPSSHSVDVLVEALRKLQAMQIVEQMDIIENALATYSKPITEDKDNG